MKIIIFLSIFLCNHFFEICKFVNFSNYEKIEFGKYDFSWNNYTSSRD